MVVDVEEALTLNEKAEAAFTKNAEKQVIWKDGQQD